MPLRVLAIAFGFTAVTAIASPLPDYPFVFTVGTAKIDTPPDLVRLSFVVVSRNKDLKAAGTTLDSTFNSVVTILTAAAIREEDIDASAVNKTPVSHWDQGRNQTIPDGYEVSRSVKVTGHDLSKYPQMLKALLELPKTENFSADFDRSDRPKLTADLFATAAKDAKAHAQEMAAQFGRKLGPVRAISQIPLSTIGDQFGFSSSERENYDRMFKRSAPGNEFLAPATITISEKVNVVFELQ
jgi:uncharacterized protein YggE